MYESFYGLKRKPFSLLPDPDFLYFSKEHETAFSMLEYSLMNQDGGISVITGNVGVGKTTVIKSLLRQRHENVKIGYVDHMHGSYKQLLQWVMMAFEQEYKHKEKVELFEDFSRFVKREYENGQHVTLVIDEAQNVSKEGLEELRLLTNINTTEQYLQLVLVGQPELRDMLRRKELVQFSQRVSVCYNLAPLNKYEAHEYILHRLSVAGSKFAIFDDSACMAIWYHSRGIPRIINILCDTALVYGYAEATHSIGLELVRKVIVDKKKYNLLPEIKGDVTGISKSDVLPTR